MEIFGSAPSPPRESRPSPPGPCIRRRGGQATARRWLSRSGLTVRWSQDYGSLLELAEACDVPVRWSCRTGVCHTCETSLLSGTVGYPPDPVDVPPPATC